MDKKRRMEKLSVCQKLYDNDEIVTQFSSKLITIKEKLDPHLDFLSASRQDVLESSLSIPAYFLLRRLESFIWDGVTNHFFDNRTSHDIYLEMLRGCGDAENEEEEEVTEFSSYFITLMNQYIGDLVYVETDNGWRGEIRPISYLCIGLFCDSNWDYLSEEDLKRLSILYTGKEDVGSDELYTIVMTEQLSLLQEIKSKGFTKTKDCLVQDKLTFNTLFEYSEQEVARMNKKVIVTDEVYQQMELEIENYKQLRIDNLMNLNLPSLPLGSGLQTTSKN